MTPKHWVPLSLLGGVLALLAAGSLHALQQESLDDAGSAITLHVSSSSFADGQSMPARLTCDGANASPELQWSAAPARTKSYVIVMNDTDTPSGFVHWLAYNIPAGTHEEHEGASTPSTRLIQAREGNNNFGHAGYGGPCPPPGSPHHYVLRVFALDVDPALAAGQDKEDVLAAIKGHVLARGQLTGLYARTGE
jgi:Raf kinase inhibitor-like YbhB/YbcL family protein